MKELSEEDVNFLIRKCIDLARKKPPRFFRLKKMKNDEGSCNWTDIDLDPRCSILSTAVHECLHYLNPEWSEKRVLYTEEKILEMAKHIDLAKFLRYLGLKLYKTELYDQKAKSRKKRKKTSKKKV